MNTDFYHYTESGLDDVWLANGFDRQGFGAYGTAVAVDDEQSLWRTLGRTIASQDSRMHGQELRFLRTQLGWTQTQLGKRLGYNDGQMVARWEKTGHAPVPLAADAFIRAAYRERLGEAPMITQTSARLAEIAHQPGSDRQRVLRRNADGDWIFDQSPREMALSRSHVRSDP